jgi:predicted CoA-binding protein
MDDLAPLLDGPDVTIAVVGATDNPAKYGFAIYRDLKGKGFTVYPVNPNRRSVDGDAAFPSLRNLPEKPTLINVVVPPTVTLEILQECLDLDWGNIWLQPGAESPQVLSFLQRHGFQYSTKTCIMVETRLKEE